MKKDQTRNYQKFLMEELKSIELAAEYLTAAIEENDGKVFITAIKNILESRNEYQTTDLTRVGLAEKIGISPATLSKLSKNGVKQITIGALNKIANALDMELIIKFKPKKAA